MRRVTLNRVLSRAKSYHAGDRKVYALGEAWLGNAGLPDEIFASSPQIVPLFAERACRSLDLGWGHAAVVTSDGYAVLFGRPHDFRNTLRHINTRGQIPALQQLMNKVGSFLFKTDTGPETMPQPEDDDGIWVEASCSTAAATALLTSTGSLYTVGHNYYGQAGAGQGYAVGELPIAYSPVKVVGFDPGDPVVQVSVGFEHMLAVTASGGLYSWGRGDRGQLGLGDLESYKSAVRVLGPADVFLASPAEGDASESRSAAEVPAHSRVIACESGVSQSACITADGRLWVWGKMQGTRVKPGTGGSSDAIDESQLDAAAADRAGDRSTKVASASADADLLTSPGPAVTVGVMEDVKQPRPVYFADELLGETVDEEGSDMQGASPDTSVAPLSHDTLFNEGVVMGTGLGGIHAPTSPPPTDDDGAPLSPHNPRRRVVGMTSGHAHTSFVTDDGRLWMMGMRGRGRLFDDSAAVALAHSGPGGPRAPCLSPRVPWYGDVPAVGAPGEAQRRLPLAVDVPVPELSVQLRPWEVPLGPLQGVRLVRLRSSMHHSYGVSDDGRVFRWGWKGVVLPVAETEAAGLRVADIQFGYAHALMLASPPEGGPTAAPADRELK